MAIKTERLKEETRETSFPCLMKSEAGNVFLFLASQRAICLAHTGDYETGEYIEDIVPAETVDHWTPSPPITLSNA